MDPQTTLARWIEENGGCLGSLEIRSRPDGGRGLHASRTIQPGELLLEIPARCMVTAETVRRYPLGRRVADGWPVGELGQTGLAVFLLEQKRTADPWWAPYLASLPDRWDHLPLFYGDQEMQLLEGSSIPSAIARRRAECREQFARVVCLAPELATFSAEDYMRARVAATTRAFADRRGDPSIPTLVPLADMMDHRQPPDAVFGFFRDRGVFDMRCTRRIKEGEPVHTDYGIRSNTQLLQNYGFTVDDNPHNEATLWAAPPAWEPELDRRSREFGEWDGGRLRLRLLGRNPEGAAVLSFFRLAWAQGDEVARAMAGASGEVPVLSEQNEAAAMRALGEACRNALRRYPTSLEEDDAQLAAGVTGNPRNCIVARRSEKAVLRAWAEWAERGPIAAGYGR